MGASLHRDPTDLVSVALTRVEELLVPHLVSREELRAFEARHHRRLIAHVRQAVHLAELEAEIQALIRSAERQAGRELAEHRSRLRRGDERWGLPSRIAKWQIKALEDYHGERLGLALAAREGRIRTLQRKIKRLRASGTS